MPRDTGLDRTLDLLRDPYGFITKGCQRHGSDVFETRLLLQRTICMRGADAARLFYDPDRFVRKGAAPRALVRTLFGRGGVQAMDGDAHRRRKALFLSIVSPERVADLATAALRSWQRQVEVWPARRRVVLYDEACAALTRAVTAWAGVPVSEADLARRTRQLTSLFDQGGALGLQHVRSRLARMTGDRWIAGVVRAVRRGHHRPGPETTAHAIATYRDPHGDLLPARVAAVELLNVLRPTVAVAVFVTHAAVALHHHPGVRAWVTSGRAEDLDCIVQEVRRHAPFFPAVVARVRRDFDWHGLRFPRGRRTLLDLYGTNHEARLWRDPDAFRPERFRGNRPDPFTFVPQGGGDRATGHRCPGEDVATAVLGTSLRFLVEEVSYDLPAQDLTIDTSRLPALPVDKLVMANVTVGEEAARSPAPAALAR